MTDIEMAREAIESTYIGECDIVEYVTIKNDITKRNEHKEEKVLEKQKCRISFKNISNSNQSETTNNVTQIIKLFISPDINIKNGSKIIVTQNGKKQEYKNSGEPARYETHQEVMLELFKGWA